MTQEEKQLLLKDLSARLPYDVKVCVKLPNHQEKIFEEQIGDLKEITRYGGYLVNSKGIDYRSFNLDIKPYLRPLSSMTEEEKLMYEGLMIGADNVSYMLDVIEWLNANHFDYRGLIEKGLAIEVNESNNPYKE